jgi:hypothetical protein
VLSFGLNIAEKSLLEAAPAIIPQAAGSRIELYSLSK